jgi:hypothetical protein
MNLAERRLIPRALGPAVLAAMDRVDLRPEPGAWRALARAVIVSAGDVATDPRGRAILAAICRRAVVADDRVPGRIGEHRLSEGCYSFNEAMTLAAAHLKRTGRAGLALSLLQQGWTVRQLLRQFYGIDSGPSWDDAAERRAFRRTLQRSKEAVN